MRGKAIHSLTHSIWDGIIPAHAGKSRQGHVQRGFDGDHPRSCGEKRDKNRVIANFPGSSPLMRGKVSAPSAARCLGGIIPAHAGKRPIFTQSMQIQRDHPRSCGEKCPGTTIAVCYIGSSPLMRGKEHLVRLSDQNHGIIPAHAGKRLKQVAKTGYFRETLHFSISIWYTKWVSLQSADTRCIPAVSNWKYSAIVSSL